NSPTSGTCSSLAPSRWRPREQSCCRTRRSAGFSWAADRPSGGVAGGQDGLDRLDELIGGAGLYQVAIAPSLRGTLAVLVAGVAGQRDDDDAVAAPARSQLARDLQPRAASQEEVQHHDVGIVLAHARQRLAGIPCLERLDAVGRELCDEDAARDRIVVDDEDAQSAAVTRFQHLNKTVRCFRGGWQRARVIGRTLISVAKLH